jgi:hypothetical protein
MRVRIAVVLGVFSFCFATVAGAFWYGDYRYDLPTPRPAGLEQSPRGTKLPVERWVPSESARNRPVLLHFFNPECPCTRFNIEHVRALHSRFGGSVAFVAVAQTSLDDAELEESVRRLDFGFPYVVDPEARIAAEAGVYSTPQAVLVNEHHELVYRGNYNVSRYCTDPRTEFVRVALESLIEPSRAAPPDTPAYGCTLPSAIAAGGE